MPENTAQPAKTPQPRPKSKLIHKGEDRRSSSPPLDGPDVGVTSNTKIVQEAAKLFEADCARKSYSAGLETFVVSPVNSRRVLTTFLKRAKKQLLIYDPEISDPEIVRILQERAKAGVEVRIIGKASKRAGLKVAKLTKIRLHTRTILKDASQAFIGSQSLREAELDSRREVGLIFREKQNRQTIDRLF